MPRTPDRFPGPREEEEIRFLDQGSPPTTVGALARTGDSLWFVQSTGAIDLTASSGGGLTEGQHEVLDTLVHNIAETCYEEIIWSGVTISSVIYWTDATKTQKVREYIYSRDSLGRVIQVVIKQYDASGNLKNTLTGDYSYSGFRPVSVTWTKT